MQRQEERTRAGLLTGLASLPSQFDLPPTTVLFNTVGRVRPSGVGVLKKLFVGLSHNEEEAEKPHDIVRGSSFLSTEEASPSVGLHRIIPAWRDSSNCAKIYCSVLYAMLTHQ
jgi:hypothetical protein